MNTKLLIKYIVLDNKMSSSIDFYFKERNRHSSINSVPTANTTKKDNSTVFLKTESSTHQTKPTETSLHTEPNEPNGAHTSQLESIIRNFHQSVYSKIYNEKEKKTKIFHQKSKTLSLLQGRYNATKKEYNNTERSNYDYESENNILNFERIRVGIENKYNDEEISKTKRLNEKMKKQIELFNKSNREMIYENISNKKDLQILCQKCKELSQEIAISIESKKTLTSALLLQRKKVEMLKYTLGKQYKKENYIGNKINSLVKILS